jgi:hypothetical protein
MPITDPDAELCNHFDCQHLHPFHFSMILSESPYMFQDGFESGDSNITGSVTLDALHRVSLNDLKHQEPSCKQ